MKEIYIYANVIRKLNSTVTTVGLLHRHKSKFMRRYVDIIQTVYMVLCQDKFLQNYQAICVITDKLCTSQYFACKEANLDR